MPLIGLDCVEIRRPRSAVRQQVVVVVGGRRQSARCDGRHRVQAVAQRVQFVRRVMLVKGQQVVVRPVKRHGTRSRRGAPRRHLRRPLRPNS